MDRTRREEAADAANRKSGAALMRAELIRVAEHYAACLAERERLRREVHEWSALFEVGKTLASILDLDPLLERIVDFALEMTGGERGMVVLPGLHGGIDVRIARGAGGRSLDPSRLTLSRSVAEEVLRTGRTLALDDLSEWPRFRNRASVLRLKLHAVLCVPMLYRGTVRGAVYVDSTSAAEPFGPPVRKMLEMLASQGAVAVENSMLYDELERRTVERERARRLASLGTMAAGIAHEIRNPLGIMSNAVYFLEATEPTDDPDRKEQFNILKDEIRRGNRIIDDLLRYTRIRPPRRTRLDLRELVRSGIKGAVDAGRLAPGQAVVGMPSRAVYVDGDADQLRQVLMNLLDNAGRVSGGKPVHVSVSSGRNGAEIRVADEGPGVPAADRKRIFDPFFSTQRNGTGLGLAIVQTIVSLHGGTITATDAPGGGALFIITLPGSKKKIRRKIREDSHRR